MDLEKNIQCLGEKGDIINLQIYLETVETEDIKDLIKNKINSTSFKSLWNYILQALSSNTTESNRKRFTVVYTFLRELEESSISNNEQIKSLINRLCMELEKFNSEDLIGFCDFCLESIRSKSTNNLRWKDIVPELLNVLTKRNEIKFNDENISGEEFKKQFVNSFCMFNWSSNIIIPLTAMFVDMSLTKEEHQKIVNKLGTYVEKMSPHEIPPFIYQILKLCKDSNLKNILIRLQHYFGTRIYEKVEISSESSNDSNLDAIESCTEQELIEAEGTILFYICQAASSGHNGINEYIASLKNILRAPEFILHPFQLTVLLTISTIPHYEEKIFDLIRSCISRILHEKQKALHSQFFKDMIPKTHKFENIFNQIININAGDRELVLQGLVNFGFVLLEVGVALVRDVIVEQQWHLGTFILIKIAKKKHNIAPIIIQNLSNRIQTGQNVTQFIECLYILQSKNAILWLENQNYILELMDSLIEIPLNKSTQLLEAIVPMAKVSYTIRDHFILLLRKALYSRNNLTRQMAVIGFIKLITNFKVSSLGSLSQSSGSYSSGHSILTQISLSRNSMNMSDNFSNEALCLEVLGILKRCFMQNAEVKAQLYEGLFEAVSFNPELGIPILEVIWFHFSSFYIEDKDINPPIKFKEITKIKDVDVILQEPISKLIFSLGLIINKVSKTEKHHPTVIKLEIILESICQRMSNCELVHFELDDGIDILDSLPESQQKYIILQEALAVYEALMGYTILNWEQDSNNYASKINQLFQGYYRLFHHSKSLSKPKKAERKQKQTKDQNKTKVFKIPDSVLNFQIVIKALHLLLDPQVGFATQAEANILKAKRGIFQHFFQVLASLLQTVKSKKILEHYRNKALYENLCEIAEILYQRVIEKMQQFIDFDCNSAVLAVDCFYTIFNIICQNFKGNLKTFLIKLSGKDKEEDLVVHFSVLYDTFKNLFERNEDINAQDSDIKKIEVTLLNILHLVYNQLPNESNSLSTQMMEWLKSYSVNNSISTKALINTFINLLFDCHIKFKISLNIFENISLKLGDITGVLNEEESAAEDYKIINENSVQNIFLLLCGVVKSMLEDTDWIISRLKAEFNVLNYPGEGVNKRKIEYLKSRERNVCCHLCFITKILTNISNCTVPTGNLSEAILKNIIIYYSTLSNLTKYFTGRSTSKDPAFQNAKLETLLKLAGKQLAPTFYRYILYLEENQKGDTEIKSQQTQKKKNVDTSQLKNKVLKETRLIPKAVYEIEQLSKNIVLITNKTKIDLTKYVGTGIVRDYRILHLKETLEEQPGGLDETFNSETTEINDSAAQEQEESKELNTESSDNEISSPPPSKKLKI